MSGPRPSRPLSALLVLVALLVVLAWLVRFVQDDAFISFRYARNLAEGHGLVFNPGERVEGYTNFLWTVAIAAGLALGADAVAWSQGLGLVAFAGSLLATWALARAAGLHGDLAFLAVVLLGTNASFLHYATGGLETQLQAFLVTAATVVAVALDAGAGPADEPIPAEADARRVGRPGSGADADRPGEHRSVAPARRAGGPVPGEEGPPSVAAATATVPWSLPVSRGAGAALLSVLLALALMTRLDSAVALAIPGLLALAALVRRAPTPARAVAPVAALLLPATLLVGTWLAWKVGYYGDVLPNTYHVKAGSSTSVIRGAHYVYRFFASYWLLPVGIFLVAIRPRRLLASLRQRRARPAVALAAALLLWCGYVASVGGDFMEFRFLVPVLPLIMVLLVWVLDRVGADRRARVVVAGVLIAGSLAHATTFWGVRGIESIHALSSHMEPEGGDWDAAGRALAEHFGDVAPPVVIAVGPAGAIPYHSGLEAVDMRGLTDAWVARHGHRVGTVPGHQRMAPLGYLLRRGVHLVVGHPQVAPEGEPPPARYPPDVIERFGLVGEDAGHLPPGARIVGIPMGQGQRLDVLYLTPHPGIEGAVRRQGWASTPVAPR